MYEDSHLESAYEDRFVDDEQPYGGQLQYERDDDYNVWEEQQVFLDNEGGY